MPSDRHTFIVHVKREELWPHYRLTNHYPGLTPSRLPTIEVGKEWLREYQEAQQRYFAYQAQIARALVREATQSTATTHPLKGDPTDESNH